MSNDEKHNGWTNRETWAVALHINNDQGWQESVHDRLRDDCTSRASWAHRDDAERARIAGDIIRENVEETLDGYGNGYADSFESAWGVLSDIGSLWRVDWTELGASFLEDLREEGSSS